MNDIEVRVECIKAAVSTPGNPNIVDNARAYYAFVIEGNVVEDSAYAAATTRPAKKAK